VATTLSLRTVGALGAVLLLSSCGGGGGSSSVAAPPSTQESTTGNVPAPTTGPGDAAQYFPLAIGDSWQYDMPGTYTVAAIGAQAAVTVTGTAVVDGQTTSIFSYTTDAAGASGEDQYYASSGGGITFYGNNQASDTVTPATIPYAQLMFPVTPGQVSSVSVRNVPQGTDGSGNPVTVSFTQTVVVADLESVNVTAGSFTNVAKVVTTMNGTATDKASGQSIPISGTDTTWFAPGVGEVEEAQSTTTGNSTSTLHLAARGYTVGGVTHALGGVTTLLTGQYGPGNGGPGPAMATDGTNILLVTSDPSGVVCTLINPGGTVLATHTFATSGQFQAVAAYDGTNYEVAFAGGPFGGTQDLYVQRISPSGALVDAQPYLAATSSTITFGGPIATGNGSLLLVLPQYNPSSGAAALSGLFLSPNGTPPTASAVFSIVAPTTTSIFAWPQLVFDGTNYFTVWTNNGSILGLHLSASTGAPIESSPIVIADALPAELQPTLFFDGVNQQYFVAWMGSNGSSQAIYATRISLAGALLDGNPTSGGMQLSVVGSTSVVGYPSAAFDGSEYLVTWLENSAAQTSVRGVRLAPSGQVTSGAGFELTISPLYSTLAPIYSTPPGMLLKANGGWIAWYVHDLSDANVYVDGCAAHPF